MLDVLVVLIVIAILLVASEREFPKYRQDEAALPSPTAAQGEAQQP